MKIKYFQYKLVIFKEKYGKISDCRAFSYSKNVTLRSLRTLCKRSAKRTTLEFFHFLEALEDCK